MSEISENITINAAYLRKLQKLEFALPLLTQIGYLDRYHDHLANCKSCRIAWARTEGELVEAYGVRRFQDHQQFKDALRWARKRVKRKSVRIIESKETPV